MLGVKSVEEVVSYCCEPDPYGKDYQIDMKIPESSPFHIKAHSHTKREMREKRV